MTKRRWSPRSKRVRGLGERGHDLGRVLRLRAGGFLEGKLITTFRGFDISEYLRVHGERAYDPLFRDGDFFPTNCDFFRHSPRCAYGTSAGPVCRSSSGVIGASAAPGASCA